MSTDKIKSLREHFPAIASAILAALAAWGAMKTDVATLKNETDALRIAAAKQEERLLRVEVDAGKVGGKLEMILTTLNDIRAELRERSRDTVNR